MRLKMEKNHPLFEFCASFILNFVESPLPVIRLEFDFNKSSDTVFISSMLIKHIKKKVDRFLSITKNIHNFTPHSIYKYTGYSQNYQCFYSKADVTLWYIFYLTK